MQHQINLPLNIHLELIVVETILLVACFITSWPSQCLTTPGWDCVMAVITVAEVSSLPLPPFVQQRLVTWQENKDSLL